jgi:ribonuclease R
MLESYLHVSELNQDYFVYDADKQQLKGTRTSTTYFSGDEITVMLKKVDLIYLESQWSLIPDKSEKKRKKRRR